MRPYGDYRRGSNNYSGPLNQYPPPPAHTGYHSGPLLPSGAPVNQPYYPSLDHHESFSHYPPPPPPPPHYHESASFNQYPPLNQPYTPHNQPYAPPHHVSQEEFSQYTMQHATHVSYASAPPQYEDSNAYRPSMMGPLADSHPSQEAISQYTMHQATHVSYASAPPQCEESNSYCPSSTGPLVDSHHPLSPPDTMYPNSPFSYPSSIQGQAGRPEESHAYTSPFAYPSSSIQDQAGRQEENPAKTSPFAYPSSSIQGQAGHQGENPADSYENTYSLSRIRTSSMLPSHDDTNSPHLSPAYPLTDVLANMHVSESSRPTDSPSHEGSRFRPFAMQQQYSQSSVSYPNSPESTASSSFHYDRYSESSTFQYGRHSVDSSDSVHSTNALAPSRLGPQNSNKLQVVPYDGSSKRVVLLHGTLDIWIDEAKSLPNMDLFSETMRQMFTRTGSGKTSKVQEQVSRQHVITSDPYVTANLSGAVVARTKVISNSTDPVWTQHFSVPVAHNVSEIVFIVKDSDVVGAQVIGTVSIPAERIQSCERIDEWHPILGGNGKVCKPGASLKVSIQYYPAESETLSRFGFGLGPNYVGVPDTYFPLRKSGNVTLYQDAHVPDDLLPSIGLDNGLVFKQGKCWLDICNSILQARHFIYIVGWSVFYKITLVRENVTPGTPQFDTLGDLLKFKSQEGLRVLLLIWDDPTSTEILGFKKEGLMATHDEETRRFFKHSSVQVLLCPRASGKKRSLFKQTEVNFIFTHHQKSVILDTEGVNQKRKVTSFIGGLDLCDGRYDTPEHQLFRTLGTVHKEDFHNPTFQGQLECGGPRQPWHDLHCRIDGPAAYDVLTNFEQRWTKAAKRHRFKKFSHKLSEDSLLALDRLPYIMKQSEVEHIYENDAEAWHVQIFRSIDSGSVKGFPKEVKEVENKNLAYIKNLVVDMSIHTAYLHAIRSAKNFIYIENQYFLGSSYNWPIHKEIGANNMIPMELALKIADKIRAHERFAVYIVVPMWPEGVPASVAMQRILYWQAKTIQMMYDTVYKALEEAELHNTYHPQDYLNFFCLGNREAKDSNDEKSPKEPTENIHIQAKKNRRFMIYVHSKGMIVDDEYVIIGSANINQRSLDGSRDTEIAMGAYQPQYTRVNRQHPRGQVYGYRMSLWAEHLGLLENWCEHPETLECVRKVRIISEKYWKQFTDDEVTEMKGHLLKYPIMVEANGKVKRHPENASFPDVGGNVLGALTFPASVSENLTI